MKDTPFASKYAAGQEKGVKFIVSSVQDGSYGSTQATILALKVLVVYLKTSKMQGSGDFELYINGNKVKTLHFDDATKTDALDFTNDTLTWLHPRFDSFKPSSALKIELKLKNYSGDKQKFKISYALDAQWKDTQPSDVEGTPLTFTVFANGDKASIGSVKTYKLSI